MTEIEKHFLTAAFVSAIIALGGCSGNPTADRTGPPADSDGQEAVVAATSTPAPAEKPADTTASTAEAGTVTMMTGQGKTMTLTMQTLLDSREYQYCELVFNYGEKGNDIYSTSPLAEADLQWWDGLDLEELAKEFAAESVFKNGPQWWSMDEVGVMASEPVKVAGVEMVFGAHLPPGTLKIPKYTVFNPAKFQNLQWKAGKPVYQLVDADGHVYVLQGHKIPTDELATLGAKFKELPEGWEYRVKVLDEDLVMKLTPDEPIPSVQDEFDQIYIRIPEAT